MGLRLIWELGKSRVQHLVHRAVPASGKLLPDDSFLIGPQFDGHNTIPTPASSTRHLHDLTLTPSCAHQSQQHSQLEQPVDAALHQRMASYTTKANCFEAGDQESTLRVPSPPKNLLSTSSFTGFSFLPGAGARRSATPSILSLWVLV